jgi:hypothetical protein
MERGVIATFAQHDLTSAEAVVSLFERAARANLQAACRRGGCDTIEPTGRLIATGDLHDNPLHLARIVELAGLDDPAGQPRAHATFHEVIHSDRLVNGMDFSYRALARVAALKLAFPEFVHTLLANHELAQVSGAGIVKDGIPVVKAFNAGVEHAFGEDAPGVLAAIAGFIRSMPLALRALPPAGRRGALLLAHSLPSEDLLDRFDPGVLDRVMVDEDLVPRRGSAHLMTWGRGHAAAVQESLAAAWDVSLFILGHEKAPDGWLSVPPRSLILNSDHDRAAYMDLDLASPPATLTEAERAVFRLQG